MAKNDVAKVEDTKLPAEVYDYGEFGGEGFEGVTINDLSIPFLNLLQPLSPEVSEQTLEGAQAGMILNSVTREIMPQPIVFQPFFREEVWMNWRPRTAGGGVISRHESSDAIVQDVIAKNGGSRIPPRGDDKKMIPFKGPDGGDLIETYYYYGLLLDEDGKDATGYGVISFSSTKIKPMRDWMTAMMTVKGSQNIPIYAHRAKFSTLREKRDSGVSYNFAIAPFTPTWRESLIPPNTDWGKSLMEQAKKMREMIISGEAKVDQSGMKAQHEEEGAGGNAGGKGQTRGGAKGSNDDEIPF